MVATLKKSIMLPVGCFQVAKSPCCPNTTLHFSISTGGIEADVVGEETVSYLQNPAADAEIPNG